MSAQNHGLSPPKWQADLGNRALYHTLYLSFAILDLQFTRMKKGIFAIATSNGAVCLCTMNGNGTGPIEILNTYQIFPKSSLTLSLAWNRALSHSDAIAASSSDGQIAIFDTKHQPPITYRKTEAHSLETWTIAWACRSAEDDSGPELYSGGDDSALCRHCLLVHPVSGKLGDGNVPSHGYDFLAPIRDIKTHMAGVTAILPLQPDFHGERVLLTGSYDEYVRALLLPLDGRSRPMVCKFSYQLLPCVDNSMNRELCSGSKRFTETPLNGLIARTTLAGRKEQMGFRNGFGLTHCSDVCLEAC